MAPYRERRAGWAARTAEKLLQPLPEPHPAGQAAAGSSQAPHRPHHQPRGQAHQGTYSIVGALRDCATKPDSVLLGLGKEFSSKKILRNRLGPVSVIQWKKVLIPRHTEFCGRANSEARNGTERDGILRKNEVIRNSLNTEQNNF